MGLKKEYEKKLESNLEQMKLEVKQLQAKINESEADLKIEYNKKLKDIEAKQHHVERKLQEVKLAGNDAWQELKAGAEHAWQNLSDAVSAVAERFK